MNDAQIRAVALKADIEQACIRHGLNLTVYDGRIGFVDQEARKIVVLWNPEHKLSEVSGNGGE